MANMRLVKLKNRPSKGVFVFEYMQEQIERLRGQGKERTVETYQSALNSFMKFRDGIDLCFDEMDADLMEHYETEMRSTHHLSRNTTSFYMRILRCVYRKAVGDVPTKNVVSCMMSKMPVLSALHIIRSGEQFILLPSSTSKHTIRIWKFPPVCCG